MKTLLAGLAVAAAILFAGSASAQIKEPGAHPHYSVELEPHLTVAWNGGPDHYADDGIGAGFRASIPFFHNGPITTINNNLAITFGIDWVHFGYDHDFACHDFPQPYCDDHDYSANAFWLPVAVQWNFFVHPRISVFGELGLALVHERYTWARPCPGGPPGTLCEYSDSHTDFANFVFYPGARFLISDNFAFTLRLGYPHLTAGLSLFF